MAEQLKERLNIQLAPAYLRDRLRRLKEFFTSDVNLDEVEVTVGMVKLSGAIKGSPEVRRRIREALEPDTSNWLTAVNDVVGQAQTALVEKGYVGLVAIVDNLDHISLRQRDNGPYSVAEYLYLIRAAQMTAFACHVVYSMPIALAYSHHESTLKNLYGGSVPVIPMTKLHTRPPARRSSEEGVERFRQIVRARLASVGPPESALFVDDATRDELIGLSGGQPEELMRLVREAVITEGPPIRRGGLDRARSELKRSYARQLRDEYWPILESVFRAGTVVRTTANDAVFRELLDSRMILLYSNDEEWYDVNPAVFEMVRARLGPGAGRRPRRRQKT